MKTKQWFVRLGTQYIGDMCDPGTQGCTPVVNNIDAMRQVFQDGISQQQAQQAVDPTEEGGEELEEDTNDPHESDFFTADMAAQNRKEVSWSATPDEIDQETINKRKKRVKYEIAPMMSVKRVFNRCVQPIQDYRPRLIPRGI
jgi:hypothetical protein